MWRKLSILLATLWLAFAWALLGQLHGWCRNDDAGFPHKDPGAVRVYEYTSDVVVDLVTESGDKVFVLPLSRTSRSLLLTTLELFVVIITGVAVTILAAPVRSAWRWLFSANLRPETFRPNSTAIVRQTDGWDDAGRTPGPLVLDYAYPDIITKPRLPIPLQWTLAGFIWVAAIAIFLGK